MHRHWLSGLLLTWCLFATACGSSGNSPSHLSGKVTFNGKPVPAGRVFFLPNAAKGGAGQGGFAEIKDGTYDTRSKGAGTPGGPLIVRIDGFDGKSSPGNPIGQALFLSFEFQVDIPAGGGTKDFDVPAKAAQSVPKGGGGEAP